MSRIAGLFLLVLAGGALAGCADPLAEAQKVNTIEGWEKYIAEHDPDGSDKLLADNELAALLIKKARETHATADFDKPIQRFPKHKDIKQWKEERIDAAWAEAEAANTPEAWKKFLDENPDAARLRKDRARGMVAIAEYGGIQLTEVKIEQVNLAEDPKGPKDGWGFTVTVTNGGNKEIDYLNLEVSYYGKDGNFLSSEKWPIVADSGPGGVPVTEETTKVLKPGESRVWNFTSGNVPADWGQQAKVKPIAVRFVGTPPKEGAKPE